MVGRVPLLKWTTAEKGTLILASLLEDLENVVGAPEAINVALRIRNQISFIYIYIYMKNLPS